jgi:hypothetical protein
MRLRFDGQTIHATEHDPDEPEEESGVWEFKRAK